ncbi:MAG: DEAD/DEAH box helicase [Thermoguttaceae bacterium]|jgi:DNA helicase-2/ATP-dependent DNA helicase PcrA|nr:DEAD/DEAH box helicase [Thermoguttaceae bacterium]
MYTYGQFVQVVRASLPRFAKHWLNPEQDQAVAAPPHPPTFIVAGPGAGKTTVLVLRTLKLILVDRIPPAGIVATTFTRKAAAELRSRVLSWGYCILSYLIHSETDPARLQWVRSLDMNLIRTGTLDSLSEQFLADCRQPGEIVPATIEGFLAKSLMRRHALFPNGRFRNADLKQLLLNLGLTSNRNSGFSDELCAVMTVADRIRHDAINLATYAPKSAGHQVLCDAIADYLIYLEQNHLADFGRLESLVLDRLRQNRLTQVVSQHKALLIDEFQDTNYLQEQIYLELCRQSRASLTVVGDDDQSIFRFRGATVEIFANFNNRITGALGPQWQPTLINLYRNYRSTERIVRFCQHFIGVDPVYQAARVPQKPSLIACAPHANDAARNVPILGMFRRDMETLAKDLTSFLWDVFRGNGRLITCDGVTYRIWRSAPDGDFGDGVLLAYSVRETAGNRARLPLLTRRELNSRGVRTFNPRGRKLAAIQEVQQLLGLALDCIDPNGHVLAKITSMARADRSTLTDWIQEGRRWTQGNPRPGGLADFVHHWQRRTVGAGSGMTTWPREWPLLELIFTLTTWFPIFQTDPEGQVYLEAIARTIAEAGQMSSYGARLVFGGQHEDNSVREAIRTIFEPIAQGAVDVDEEIMPYVPRNYFPIMTIHQAKGLEFPLVIVDVGSDFRTNHASQRRSRAPTAGDAVHRVEDDVVNYCAIGRLRTRRSSLDRAWDDLRRLYFVAFSRPQNVLLLVGLTTVIRQPRPMPCIAAGALSGGGQGLTFVPAAQWSTTCPANTVALI